MPETVCQIIEVPKETDYPFTVSEEDGKITLGYGKYTNLSGYSNIQSFNRAFDVIKIKDIEYLDDIKSIDDIL